MSEQTISYEEQIYRQPSPDLRLVSGEPLASQRLQLRNAVVSYLEGEIDDEPTFSIYNPREIRDVKVALSSASANHTLKESADGREYVVYESISEQKAARIRRLQTLLVPDLEEAEHVRVGRFRNKSESESASEMQSTLISAKEARAKWTAEAACRGSDPNRFYPLDLFTRGRPTTNKETIKKNKEDIISVVELCYTCPVRQQCEDYGWTVQPEKYIGVSVFGGKFFGLTDSQQKYLIRLGLKDYIPEKIG